MRWLLRLRSCLGLLRRERLRCGRWLLLVLLQRCNTLLLRLQLSVLLRLRSSVAMLLLRRHLLVLLQLGRGYCGLQLRQQLSVRLRLWRQLWELLRICISLLL